MRPDIKRVHCVAFAALAACFGTAGAFAQERPEVPAEQSDLTQFDVEELVRIKVQSVFGASRLLQQLTDAPASVSVVTHEDIRAYGYRTLVDVLRSAHGFNVTYDRNYSYVGIRGYQRTGDYNSRILLLVDGHRTNDNVYDLALLGTEFPIDLEFVDRVEIIRGPSSSVYGTNAFLAVVNVVTRRAGNGERMEIAAEQSSLATRRGRVLVTGAWNNVDLVFGGSLYNSAGHEELYFPEFDSPATNNGIADGVDRDRYTRLFGSAQFGSFTVQGAYGSRKKNVPTASFGTIFNDPNLQTVDTRAWIDLKHTRQVGSHTVLTSRLYYDHYDYDGRYPEDSSDPDTPPVEVFRDYSRGKWWGAEFTGTRTLAAGHRIVAGAEFRDNIAVEQGGVVEWSNELYFQDQRRSQVWATFLEGQFLLGKHVIVDGGVRHDRYDGFGGTTNPRFGLIVKPRPQTAIKLLWGSAFRAPNAYERFYSDRSSQVGNPDLEPETIRTGEIVFEQYFERNYRISATIFASRIDGLITQAMNAEGLLQFQNLDSAKSRGGAVELEAKWSWGLGARANYTYQVAEDGRTGDRLANSVRQMVSIAARTPVWNDRIEVGVDMNYVGPVLSGSGGVVPGFVVPNFTLTARPARAFEFLAGIYNFTGSRYAYPAGAEHTQQVLQQDGRSFRVGLTYSRVRDN